MVDSEDEPQDRGQKQTGRPGTHMKVQIGQYVYFAKKRSTKE